MCRPVVSFLRWVPSLKEHIVGRDLPLISLTIELSLITPCNIFKVSQELYMLIVMVNLLSVLLLSWLLHLLASWVVSNLDGLYHFNFELV